MFLEKWRINPMDQGISKNLSCHLLFHKLLALLYDSILETDVGKRNFRNENSMFITILTNE